MNFAIIGRGFIFSRHCDAIKKTGGKVIMDCDIDPKKGAKFLNYKDMLNSDKFKKEVDAVVICTPNFLHYQMAIDALATGKKVLVEKPCVITNNFKGLNNTNHVLQLRHHDFTDKIKQSLTGNDNIDLVMKVCRDKNWWDSWRGDKDKSGGILMGIAIHMFDYLIFLLGDEYKVIKSKKSKKECSGIIKFPTALINYYVEILDNSQKDQQTRSFIINGENFEFQDGTDTENYKCC